MIVNKLMMIVKVGTHAKLPMYPPIFDVKMKQGSFTYCEELTKVNEIYSSKHFLNKFCILLIILHIQSLLFFFYIELRVQKPYSSTRS